MSDENIYKSPEADLQAQTSADQGATLVVARRQKTLLYVFLVYLLMSGIVAVTPDELRPIVQLLTLPMLLAIVVFTARLSWVVYGKVVAVILTILSIVPLLNILVVLAANSRATSRIKQQGYRVGFMGANISEIQKSASKT